MSENQLFDREDLGDIVVIMPQRDMGEFELAELDVPAYEQLVQLTLDQHVVIDFSQTDYFGSSTIGLFLKFVNHLKRQNRYVVFCNLSAHEQDVIDITHMGKFWNLKPTRQEAIDDIRTRIASQGVDL